MSTKNPMTPAGIQPATFRFVAQHLNHCATAIPPDTCPALYYGTVLRDSCSEMRLLNSTDFKEFSLSMRRSEDVLSAGFFLVDHSNVEMLHMELSGKGKGYKENIYVVSISTQANSAKYAEIQIKEKSSQTK